jgi:hypothetical protein
VGGHLGGAWAFALQDFCPASLDADKVDGGSWGWACSAIGCFAGGSAEESWNDVLVGGHLGGAWAFALQDFCPASVDADKVDGGSWGWACSAIGCFAGGSAEESWNGPLRSNIFSHAGAPAVHVCMYVYVCTCVSEACID